MKIKNIIWFFILIILIFFVGSTSENKISEEVYDQMRNNEEVRVMVELKEPIQEKGFFLKTQKTSSEIEKEKENIKDDLINQIEEEDIKHIFENTLALELSKEEIYELGNNPNVDLIFADRLVQAFLQDSIPLINANKTWAKQISGINLTGTGETICIIDTGINFTHPDFQNRILAEYCYCSLNEGAVSDCCPDETSEDNNSKDNNGHGTHVAGIVAANGGIRGVAINVGIVSIKVLNSSGTGSGSDIRAAIDWCVSNSSIYNISVISMSLGGDIYNSYCDNSIDGIIYYRDSINSAIAKNISVIVATGNDGNKTHISSPACIQNATAVGATDKSNNIASYSNRNNLTDLFAPGSNINSTNYLGGYIEHSGTSMATPHVAGAFAIVRQFFILQNGRVPTPSEIQNALNNTGVLIDDNSGSRLNFSRIDIYSAILSLENISQNITLISPENSASYSSNSQEIIFVYNISNNFNASNCSLIINNVINLTNSSITV